MNSKKTALVTGSSKGIGAAIALRLANDGFNLILNCRNGNLEKNKIFEVAKKCEKNGAKTMICFADVSIYSECEQMIKTIKNEFLTIDCLINNAGIIKDNFLIRMTELDFDLVTQTNYKSVFNLCKLVGNLMFKQKSGRIVNLTSVVGISGNVGQFNYAASKAGIIGMTKTAAKELGQRGVLVNAVAPGFVDTQMTQSIDEKLKNEVLKRIALKRFAKPEEIAGVVSFLCGPDSSYINGQVLVVDGSLSI